MVSKERFLAFLAAKRMLQWEARLGAAVCWVEGLGSDFGVLSFYLCVFLILVLGGLLSTYVECCDRLTAGGSLCCHSCWC